ncbi:Aste57867_11999 [Aphanomyces stellatus]|uniref:Aste57867_11999 protein n=1 Tax=Aphanomyces stellatus TaxID=120398 RepID=A0A485KUE2_9STRA|nr:hypothetical protein As57867_011954 [Aphanomyces stellatus]VFT88854.1 Aste57867_11999 [Aphanomyces stellatus]
MSEFTLMEEAVEKIALCRQAVVQATHRLFDDVTANVHDAAAAMDAVTQRGIQDGAIDMEVAALNKFVHFVCDKLDVRHVDGLVKLAQAFVWNDETLINDFIQHGKNVVLYSKEASCAKLPVLDPILAQKPTALSHSTATNPTMVDSSNAADAMASLRRSARETLLSMERASPPKRKAPEEGIAIIPPYAKKCRGDMDLVNDHNRPTSAKTPAARRGSQRFAPTDTPTKITVDLSNAPKSKREAVERVLDGNHGRQMDLDSIAARVMEEFGLSVHPEYVRKILAASRRPSLVAST